jgi:hypothetical protein
MPRQPLQRVASPTGGDGRSALPACALSRDDRPPRRARGGPAASPSVLVGELSPGPPPLPRLPAVHGRRRLLPEGVPPLHERGRIPALRAPGTLLIPARRAHHGRTPCPGRGSWSGRRCRAPQSLAVSGRALPQCRGYPSWASGRRPGIAPTGFSAPPLGGNRPGPALRARRRSRSTPLAVTLHPRDRRRRPRPPPRRSPPHRCRDRRAGRATERWRSPAPGRGGPHRPGCRPRGRLP